MIVQGIQQNSTPRQKVSPGPHNAYQLPQTLRHQTITYRSRYTRSIRQLIRHKRNCVRQSNGKDLPVRPTGNVNAWLFWAWPLDLEWLCC